MSFQSCAVILVACLYSLAPRAPGQTQFVERLVKGYLPADSDSTRAFALGDVDGDLDVDVVLGNYSTQNRLYLNDGTGVFTNATAGRMPADVDWTEAVVLGDVDGDLDLDLVLGNSGIALQNRLYLNDGTGTFTDVTAARMPPDSDTTMALALGDVDGDGDLDLVLGNTRFPGQNRLYLNDGTGTFTDVTASHMPVVQDSTGAVALGDVDGDLDLDLVTGADPGQNRLYLNDGTGVFADVTPERMPVRQDISHTVALGDIDGDLDLDLAIGNSPASVSGQNRLYLNDGTGIFTDVTTARMPTDAYDTLSIQMADMDGDLDVDLVLGNGGLTRQDRLYLNDGTGTFTDATAGRMPADTSLTDAAALSDFDGDGDIDILTGNRGQNLLYMNDGTTTFANVTVERLPGFADTAALALGDVDADGDLDLAVGNANAFAGEQNCLYLNDGTGTFRDTTVRMPRDSDVTQAVAFGDVDGDGDLDLVLGNGGLTPQNRLYLNNGTGTFNDVTGKRMPADGAQTEAVALADVDGDDDLDIVFGNTTQSRLYLNDGTGTFSDATAGRLPIFTETRDLALGDVDGDTDVDIVAAIGGSPPMRNRLYLNDGTGTFTDATAARMPEDVGWSEAVALGDIDGDRDLDIVIGNFEVLSSPAQNRLYLNDGTGTFSDATAARMPVDDDDVSAVALADVDEDGDLDLVLGSVCCPVQPNRLYLNDGSGRFTDATAARLPPDLNQTKAVALADVDGDGDSDIVFGVGGVNRLYTNLHRQLFALVIPTLSQPYGIELSAKPGYATSSHTAGTFLGFALLPTPLQIPPLGTLFVVPSPIVLPAVSIPQTIGRAVQQLAIPAHPAFLGVVLYPQGLIVNDARPEDLHLTGYAVDPIRG